MPHTENDVSLLQLPIYSVAQHQVTNFCPENESSWLLETLILIYHSITYQETLILIFRVEPQISLLSDI
jgi:hypothetical protein